MYMQDNPYGIEVPPLSRELIDALKDRFPERCPTINESEREIWMYAGRRAAVLWLADQYERQQRAAETGDMLRRIVPRLGGPL